MKSQLFLNKWKIYFLIGILIVILFLFVSYLLDLISSFTYTFVQFITGIAGGITICLLFYRAIQNDEQLNKIEKQISIQEINRRNQQYIDAVKLIEENNNYGSKIAGLSILKSLSIEDEKNRQRVLDYLGTHTEELKSIVNTLFNKYKSIDIFRNGTQTLHFQLEFHKLAKKKFKFEYECLKLCEKIIQLKNKSNKGIDITHLFLPFMKITSIDKNRILALSNENLIGLNHVGQKKLGNFFFNYSISNFSSIQNCYDMSKSVFINSKLYNIYLKDVKNFNLPNQIYNSFLEKLKITFNTFDLTNSKILFQKTIFFDVKITNEFENYGMPYRASNKVFQFNNCMFASLDLTDLTLEEIYFKDTETKIDVKMTKNESQRPNIHGLDTINILSNNKNKLKIMKEDIKQLIKLNPNIKMPKKLQDI